ncbi:uncharacterized protein UU046-like isoform X3 [Pecten maximus]|uniref:uncharacterized protein UU046-like isoform X3 n=1 Tax=Pecten maximus TaxID=6579 RepID=UPI0014581600|nr:uncharacterized protein UU046-like isoform X3 [Pecten maximus]
MSRSGNRRTSRQNSVRSQNRNYYYSDAYTDDERRYVVRDDVMTDKEAWVEDYVYGRSRGSTRRPQSALAKSGGYRAQSPGLVEVGRYEKDGKIFCDYRMSDENYSEPVIIRRKPAPPPPPKKVRHVGVQMTTNYTAPAPKKVPTRDAFTQTRVNTRQAYTQSRPPKTPKPKEPSPIVVIPAPSPPRTPTPPPPKIEEPQYIYVPKTRPKQIVVRTEHTGRPGYLVSERRKSLTRSLPLRVIEYDNNRSLKDKYIYVRPRSAIGRSKPVFVPDGVRNVHGTPL